MPKDKDRDRKVIVSSIFFLNLDRNQEDTSHLLLLVADPAQEVIPATKRKEIQRKNIEEILGTEKTTATGAITKKGIKIEIEKMRDLENRTKSSRSLMKRRREQKKIGRLLRQKKKEVRSSRNSVKRLTLLLV